MTKHHLVACTHDRHAHAMMGGIDASMAQSIALHERLGFKHVGTLPQVGFKFGDGSILRSISYCWKHR